MIGTIKINFATGSRLMRASVEIYKAVVRLLYSAKHLPRPKASNYMWESYSFEVLSTLTGSTNFLSNKIVDVFKSNAAMYNDLYRATKLTNEVIANCDQSNYFAFYTFLN